MQVIEFREVHHGLLGHKAMISKGNMVISVGIGRENFAGLIPAGWV